MTIEGGTRHEFVREGVPFIDYSVWLTCLQCGAPRDAMVLCVPKDADSEDVRKKYAQHAETFLCKLCGAEIPFTADEQNGFLALFEGR